MIKFLIFMGYYQPLEIYINTYSQDWHALLKELSYGCDCFEKQV